MCSEVDTEYHNTHFDSSFAMRCKPGSSDHVTVSCQNFFLSSTSIWRDKMMGIGASMYLLFRGNLVVLTNIVYNCMKVRFRSMFTNLHVKRPINFGFRSFPGKGALQSLLARIQILRTYDWHSPKKYCHIFKHFERNNPMSTFILKRPAKIAELKIAKEEIGKWHTVSFTCIDLYRENFHFFFLKLWLIKLIVVLVKINYHNKAVYIAHFIFKEKLKRSK